LPKIYKTAVDWWLDPTLAIGPLVGAGVTVGSLVAGQLAAAVIGGGVLTFVVLLYMLVVIPIRYEIADGALTVRAGVALRLVIAWDRVRSIEPSSSPISSPALSMKRLRVTYAKPDGKDGWVLISPTDRTAFLADVADASGGRLKLDGDRLVRR
jgi:hypothetical protein